MRQPDFERLKTVFAQFPQIQAVYLFGSLAAGRGRLDSDLDLAVVSAHGRPSSEKLDILARLAREGFCMVRPEVIRKRLNKIDEVLQNGLGDIEELQRVFARFL